MMQKQATIIIIIAITTRTSISIFIPNSISDCSGYKVITVAKGISTKKSTSKVRRVSLSFHRQGFHIYANIPRAIDTAETIIHITSVSDFVSLKITIAAIAIIVIIAIIAINPTINGFM